MPRLRTNKSRPLPRVTIVGPSAELVAAIASFVSRHEAIEAVYLFDLFRLVHGRAEANTTRLVIEWCAPLERLRNDAGAQGVTSKMLANFARCQAEGEALIALAGDLIDWPFTVDLRHPAVPTKYSAQQLRSLRTGASIHRKIWIVS